MKKNLLLKFLVLLFAILLWYQQILMQEQITEMNIPIKLLNLPHNLIIDSNSISEFSIKLKASGMDILFLKMSDSYLEIDATKLKYGKNRIKLTNNNFHYPERLDISILHIGNEVRPIITMDKIVTSSKPIDIIFASAKDEEYFIKNKILINNDRIEISGPKSILDTIKIVHTEPAFKKMVKNNSITLKLLLPTDKVSLSKDSINLEVSRTKMIIRTITLIPIKYPESENITIIPQKVSVMVSGPIEIINKLTQKSIKAKLNYNKLLNNKTANVSFILPPGVKLLEYTPNKIQIIEND